MTHSIKREIIKIVMVTVVPNFSHLSLKLNQLFGDLIQIYDFCDWSVKTRRYIYYQCRTRAVLRPIISGYFILCDYLFLFLQQICSL
jgi:hypothetical protein